MEGLCGKLAASELRLATADGPLPDGSVLSVTHRVDTPVHYCTCGRCGVRKTIGDLTIAKRRRPNLVLTHLKISKGLVLQRYYEVSTRAQDAVPPPPYTAVSARFRKMSSKTLASSTRGRIVGVNVWERQRTFLDDVTTVNSLVNPNDDANSQRFSITFWSAILAISAFLLMFFICVAYACYDEGRNEGDIPA